MKKIVFIILLMATNSAFAQQAAQSDPQAQIERTIGSMFIANTNLQSQVTALQSKIEDLQKQLKEEKVKNAPSKP